MITDNPDFWNSKANTDKWQEYILPGRTADEFEAEGALQALKFKDLINENSTVLEYGCGVGRITRYLKLWCDKAIGIDLCETYIKKAKARNSKIRGLSFFTIAEYAKKENVADVIICIMVMQHNSEQNRNVIIQDIFNLLKPDGMAIISFPKHDSTLYKETEFVHKFTYREVENYGARFANYSIIEGNLVNYKTPTTNTTHEYFLKVKK